MRSPVRNRPLSDSVNRLQVGYNHGCTALSSHRLTHPATCSEILDSTVPDPKLLNIWSAAATRITSQRRDCATLVPPCTIQPNSKFLVAFFFGTANSELPASHWLHYLALRQCVLIPSPRDTLEHYLHYTSPPKRNVSFSCLWPAAPVSLSCSTKSRHSTNMMESRFQQQS